MVTRNKGLVTLLSSVVLVFSLNACAIDNPDSPDYLGQFQEKVAQYEEQGQNLTGNREMAQYYSRYLAFLDEELNDAYKELIPHLGSEEKEKLKKSQLAWIKYRDAEFAFVDQNWNRANFGSSYLLSRGGYKASIIKERVKTLLYYLKNY
ncbi:DUF1311 domain-containing protein [Gallaecimonas kandeliae]|uniref:lysozyme inhibitor LprI family protein n=1 Tax=Gallaecimonas kandeliae TaxID=3029055 RepID=UPI002649F1C1|nr:lysozyme inhibitor LprI family protein [Gallaecimonas kandeliae]WKE66210.1 DUF1311 domain-containing protein [Gallaecimonas kandeliae]